MTTTSGENLRACAAKHHPRIVGALRGLEDARRVPAEARGPRPQDQRPVWGYPNAMCASPNPPKSPPLHDKKPQTNPRAPSKTPQARLTAAEGR